jgi:hypothetical protein
MRMRVAVINFGQAVEKTQCIKRLDPWKGLDLHFLSGPLEQVVPLVPPYD